MDNETDQIPSGGKLSNVPEMSVSEISNALKNTLEQTYGHVRVRGELSRVKIPGSGHMYSDLKDDQSVLNVICWKGVLSRLSVKPEEGLEVICTGRISSYPARSNYQMIIESMELAGEGALLKLLEQRKKALAAEGLFDQSRKVQKPFLPEVIGVVTSPTGAVIRDIMHRLRDRFPRHVLLWPVRVQGEGAAEEVAAAIQGFNNIPAQGGSVPRPDLLIVARGGGSLEDLMAFNEENVVRAAAASQIPLISAIGHETDITLLDYVADLRAPTPTGAAEIAVPSRIDLAAQIHEGGHRLSSAVMRNVTDRGERLKSLGARLPSPERMLENRVQRLDHISQSMDRVYDRYLLNKSGQIDRLSGRLLHPRQLISQKGQVLQNTGDRLTHVFDRVYQQRKSRLKESAVRLRAPDNALRQGRREVQLLSSRLQWLSGKILEPFHRSFETNTRMLESLSYENVLERGFVVLRDEGGTPLTAPDQTKKGQAVQLEFSGKQRVDAIIGKNPQQKPKKETKTDLKADQGKLF